LFITKETAIWECAYKDNLQRDTSKAFSFEMERPIGTKLFIHYYSFVDKRERHRKKTERRLTKSSAQTQCLQEKKNLISWLLGTMSAFSQYM
jgi:hypothetical protein